MKFTLFLNYNYMYVCCTGSIVDTTRTIIQLTVDVLYLCNLI